MANKTRNAFLIALLLACSSERAWAVFHLMRIVEIFPGTVSVPTAQYVMLRMYAPGQNFVGGRAVEVFDRTGTSVGEFMFAADLPNGAADAPILVATADAATLFGVAPDLTLAPVLPAAGGAVCFDAIDCVAWGDFSAPSSLPSFASLSSIPAALTLGMAEHRDLVGRSGATTDFVLAAPVPVNNAGQSGVLTCAGDCGGDGEVSVNELITLVNIALGTAPITDCEAGDTSRDGDISIDEILTAVNNALNGCAAPL